MVKARKSIEVVVTSCTRNAVVRFRAHGFESHLFRQRQKTAIFEPKMLKNGGFCYISHFKMCLISPNVPNFCG